MTAERFVTDFIMHDSLMEDVVIRDNGTTIVMLIDFAFWMQRWYKKTEPETGTLKVVFEHVGDYSIPNDTNWDEISILETNANGSSVKFLLMNDSTDDYLEIVINSNQITVENMPEE